MESAEFVRRRAGDFDLPAVPRKAAAEATGADTLRGARRTAERLALTQALAAAKGYSQIVHNIGVGAGAKLAQLFERAVHPIGKASVIRWDSGWNCGCMSHGMKNHFCPDNVREFSIRLQGNAGRNRRPVVPKIKYLTILIRAICRAR